MDIYDVIKLRSNPSSMSRRSKTTDPVYYVGIYDKKPTNLPEFYEIEIMSTKIGKRYTCLLPIHELYQQKKLQQNSKDNAEIIDDIINNLDNNDINSINEGIIEMNGNVDELNVDGGGLSQDNEPEIIKTFEERIQEVDTLKHREMFINEIVMTKNGIKKGKKACFDYKLNTQYWWYEVCLFNNVIQYHGAKRSPMFKLGNYVDVIDVGQIMMNKHYKYSYLKELNVFDSKIWNENEYQTGMWLYI